MSNLKINGEKPFQILSHSFSVSPSESGYTLQYSANGIDYTDWSSSTPANDTLIVNGVAKGMFFKLKDNTSEVDIQF